MGVLWAIPVQLQGSWVTLLAVIVIQEIKKPWKRAGFYSFCVLMHWYLLSWEPIFALQYCSLTGILPANAESGCMSTNTCTISLSYYASSWDSVGYLYIWLHNGLKSTTRAMSIAFIQTYPLGYRSCLLEPPDIHNITSPRHKLSSSL